MTTVIQEPVNIGRIPTAVHVPESGAILFVLGIAIMVIAAAQKRHALFILGMLVCLFR